MKSEVVESIIFLLFISVSQCRLASGLVLKLALIQKTELVTSTQPTVMKTVKTNLSQVHSLHTSSSSNMCICFAHPVELAWHGWNQCSFT